MTLQIMLRRESTEGFDKQEELQRKLEEIVRDLKSSEEKPKQER